MKHKDRAHIHSTVPTVDDFIAMAKQTSLIIGMRLHSLILGTSVGAPVIGLAYMSKVNVFMDSLDENEYIVDLKTVTADRLIDLTENIFANYDAISSKIFKEVNRLQSIAMQGIEEIVELAEG